MSAWNLLRPLRQWLLEHDHKCQSSEDGSPCWCVQERAEQCGFAAPSTTWPSFARHSEQQQPRTYPSPPSSNGSPPTHIRRGFAPSQAFLPAVRLIPPLTPPSTSSRKRKMSDVQQDSQAPKSKRQYNRESSLSQESAAGSPTQQPTPETSRRRQISTYERAKLRPFRFLSLPEKVRQRIYGHLFPQKTYHWFWHSRALARAMPLLAQSVLLPFKYPVNILRTCKFIHNEARSAIYNRLTVFCDLRPDRVIGFDLRMRPAPRLDMVKHMVFNVQLDMAYSSAHNQQMTSQQSWRHIGSPSRIPYAQLQRLSSLQCLNVRAGYETSRWDQRGAQFYDSLMKAHLTHMIAALPNPTVRVAGVDVVASMFQKDEMCASMEVEINEVEMNDALDGKMAIADRQWVDARILKARSELWQRQVRVHQSQAFAPYQPSVGHRQPAVIAPQYLPTVAPRQRFYAAPQSHRQFLHLAGHLNL